MNNALMWASGNDVTGTDPAFFKALDDEFHFVADMAALKSNRKVQDYFGPDHEEPARRDSLTADWPRGGYVYCNPPYSRGMCGQFVAKAAEQRRRGVLTVMLLAARTDTQWFHQHVYSVETRAYRPGVSVRFVKGRLRFEGHKNAAPFPSIVVVFD